MLSSIKIYIYAALFVGSIAFFMRYDHLVERVKKQDIEIAQYVVNAEIVAKQIESADIERTEYLKQIEAGKNEIDTLRNNVSSGAAVLRVQAKCPVPKTSTDTAGTIAASPELTDDARENYYAHRNDENEIVARLDLCVKTLQDERK